MIGIDSKEWNEIIHSIGDEADKFIRDYKAIPEDVIWNWYVLDRDWETLILSFQLFLLP